MKKIIFPLIAAGLMSCSCATCGKKEEPNQNMKKQESNTEKKMNESTEMKKNQKKDMNSSGKMVKPQNGGQQPTTKRW